MGKVNMAQIIKPLDAKIKFVKSLTNQDNDLCAKPNDDFLKPVRTRRIVNVTIIEEINEPHGKSLERKNDGTVSKQEYLRISRLLESQDEVPGWAKLALSSSKPNVSQKIDYY